MTVVLSKKKTSNKKGKKAIPRWLIIVSLVAVVFFAFLFAYKSLVESGKVKGLQTQSVEFPAGAPIAVWHWTPPDEMRVGNMMNLVTFMSSEKINIVYLDISKYIDIYEGSKDRTMEINKFEDSLGRFINVAHTADIKVHALMGSPNWSRKDIQYVPLKIMDFVYGYNSRNQDQKFDGVQFDIEFYGQDDYKDNKEARVKEFLDLTQLIISKNLINNKDPEFELGFAMPFWIDEVGTLPTVEWRGKVMPFVNHFLFTLDANPKSYIALMSYRNIPTGSGGTIDIVQDKVDYLETNTRNISLIIGQETVQNEEEKITFYGSDRQTLKKAIAVIEKKFRGKRVFGGFAIHDLEGYRALPENATRR